MNAKPSLKQRTEVKIKGFENKLTYQSRIALMGSCFAENIGDLLKEDKFEALVNPVGIAYNPYSLCEYLGWAIGSEEPSIDFLERAGLWYAYQLHSTINEDSREALQKVVEKKIYDFSTYLREATMLVLTFGSAWAYQHRELDIIVANNHKQPPSLFDKVLLRKEDILPTVQLTLDALRKFNPDLQVILTVSPVKHLRDGLQENALSKAHLLLLCQELEQDFEHVHYFPSYEIVSEELRDYRYYEEDMAHPNSQAIDYIYRIFLYALLDPRTAGIHARVQKFVKSCLHRPFQKGEEYRKFLHTLREEAMELRKLGVPGIEEDLHEVEDYLNNLT